MLPKGLLKEYSTAIAVLTRGVDMLAVLLAGVLAYFIRFESLTLEPNYRTALALGLILAPLTFSFANIYTSVRGEGFLKHAMTLVQAIFILGLLLAGVSFATRTGPDYSRVWFACWMGFSLCFLILYRCSLLALLRFMRARGLNERRIVIVGANELGFKFANTVQQALWTGFRIVTFMDDVIPANASTQAIPVVKTPAQLSDYLKQEGIDEIWLALPLRDEARVQQIQFALRHHPITIRFVLDIFGWDLLNHSMTEVAGFPVLNLSASPMMGLNRFIKAIEDRILAACILIFISPILLLITLGVKCSSAGPVFFRQKRLGWDGRIIEIYKFRTMNLHTEEAGRVTQATHNDQRVTAFGRFLRKSSLDELPQFINVLQGRMSIVGPRPHALAHNEHYKESIDAYMQRHRVKPGITGWAQINGWRGETDTLEKMQKRVEFDLYYINNWSLRFDLKIIFLTILRGFYHRNAY